MVDLIVQSKIRAYIRKKGLNTGGDTIEAVEKAFSRALNDAVQRAKETQDIMARDA